ncbi:MAG TPA: DUF5615 family PIN-like protein [bacterium]|jgi:predicted nuclease of predicted toxin-antitoxin system
MSGDAAHLRFLVDMPVARRVADWLRKQEHDVVHLSERGLQRATDAELFTLAAAEQRTILTSDLDFAAIAALSRGAAASVLLLRLSDMRSQAVIQRLNAALPACTPALLQGAVVTVDATRVRIRRLPIGTAED